MATPLDLTTLEDEVLDAMRVAIATEQERRQRREQLPEQIDAMCRAAVAAGIPAAEVLAAAERGATPAERGAAAEAASDEEAAS